ncbi:hypothetical protein BDZ97DRAFT_2057865 [Flammula alnicola]|nr:hypothetical protein BDZ97DRAFT_2057865 [Flammula alnicola]
MYCIRTSSSEEPYLTANSQNVPTPERSPEVHRKRLPTPDQSRRQDGPIWIQGSGSVNGANKRLQLSQLALRTVDGFAGSKALRSRAPMEDGIDGVLPPTTPIGRLEASSESALNNVVTRLTGPKEAAASLKSSTCTPLKPMGYDGLWGIRGVGYEGF